MFKAFTDIIKTPSRQKSQINNRQAPVGSGERSRIQPFPRSRSGGKAFDIIDPASAIKSGAFSQTALDFINGQTDFGGATDYADNLLLQGYFTSVYMFAALRRVANLISRVKIAAELRDEDGQWIRAQDDHPLNVLFERAGSNMLKRMYLNFAVYGSTVVFKTKTRRAQMAQWEGRPIYDFKDGAVAGLHVLDKPLWEIDEEYQWGEIRGLHVAQYNNVSQLEERNYLDRNEFVFYSDWNPNSPNRGRSIVASGIHEATTNSAIAQWMAEYFTRGAMPLILVTLDEEEPDLLTDADLMKYKRQFEDYWQGMSASLRSLFMDRKVSVEQIGISADEVNASQLNETALEGIASVVGIDRKLIVATDGGAYAEQVQLVKSAWENTVIPIAKEFLNAFQTDLGIDHEAMRLVLDLSEVSELEADREDRANVETSLFEAGAQTFNEMRTRLNMPPIKEFEGWMYYDGKMRPIDQVVAETNLPSEAVRDYVSQLWGDNLIKKSVALDMLGLPMPKYERDGYKDELDAYYDFVQGLWGDDLLKRSEVLSLMGFALPHDADDGYRSELERGADYSEWIASLWGDNLLTRSQVIELLGLEVDLPENFQDGYIDEINERHSKIMELWGDNLLTRRQTMAKLGIEAPADVEVIEGYMDEIDRALDVRQEARQNHIDTVMDWWGDNLLTKSQAMEALGIPVPDNVEFIDGYMDNIDREMDRREDADQNYIDNIMDFWGDNLLTRSAVIKLLGLPAPAEYPDGYVDEVDEQVAFNAETYEREKDFAIDLWGENLLTKSQVLDMLGLEGAMPKGSPDGYQDAVSNILDEVSTAEAEMMATQIKGEGDAESDSSGWRSLYIDELENRRANKLLPGASAKLDKPQYNRVISDLDRFDTWELPEREKPTDQKRMLSPAKDAVAPAPAPAGDASVITSDNGDTVDMRETREPAIVRKPKRDKVAKVAKYLVDNDDDSVRGAEEDLIDDFNEDSGWEFNRGYWDDDVDVYPSSALRNDHNVIDAKTVEGIESMKSVSDTTSGFVGLFLDRQSTQAVLDVQGTIAGILDRLKVAYDPVSSDDYHVTVCYASDVGTKELRVFADSVGDFLGDAVTTQGLMAFKPSKSSDWKHPVCIAVENNQWLASVQGSCYTNLSAIANEMSQFSEPTQYTPHITLFYVNGDEDIDAIMTEIKSVVQQIDIVFDRLVVSDSTYETLGEAKVVIRPEPSILNEVSEQIIMLEKWSMKEPSVSMNDLWYGVTMTILPHVIDGERRLPDTVLNVVSSMIKSGDVTRMKPSDIDDRIKAYQKSTDDEIRAWQKASLRSRGKALRFETNVISENVSEEIRSALKSLGEWDAQSVKSVFDRYRQ